MKKIFAAAAIAATVFASCLSLGAKDRKEVLKVYNWSDYIAEGVIAEFEQWYFEQTGERIQVSYMTFDVNEAMLSKIEKGHEDYDVVCPSDYIIERMLNNGLLLPLDFADIPDSINYIKANRSPFIEKMFSSINPSIDANNYSVAYMWGTTGILYNSDEVSAEDAMTWDVLRNPKYAGKVLIKDAPRDVYAPVLIYLKRDELKAGTVTLQELMTDSSEESINAVKEYLLECKKGVCGWEADLGKEIMIKNRALVSLNWSGDAVWAIQEAAEVGVNLAYSVPEEGSCVWFDGWVIPKYAVNAKAATYFINFMCRPDIVIRNMEETGYVASSGAMEVLDSQIDSTFAPIDLSYFFGDEAASVCVNPVLYPDKSVIERCALEHDWGERTEDLLSMWQEVKGSKAGVSTYVLLGLVVLVVIIAVVASIRKKNSRGGRRPSRRR